MLVAIDHALRESITSELAYNVEPEIQTLQILNDADFPVCFFFYREEVPVEDEDETIGFYVNDLFIDFEIAVKANEENYRIEAFKELSRFKKFINQFRDIVDVRFPDACVIEMFYEGMEIVGWDNNRSAGGIIVQTSIRYRQCRNNPDSGNCGGC